VSGPTDSRPSLATTRDSRVRVGVVAIVAGLLCAFPFAWWKGFYYAHYLGGVLFQCAALSLLLIWAWRPDGRVCRTGELTEWLIAGYGALALCSSIWARLPRLALVASASILFHVMWALLLGRLLDARRHLRIVARAVFASASLATAVALAFVGVTFFARLQQIGPSFTSAVSALRADRNLLNDTVAISLSATLRALGHRNFLAIFVLPGAILAVAETAASRFLPGANSTGPLRLPKALVIFCLVLMLVGLAVSGSIGGWMGLAIGLVFLASFRMGRRWRWTLLLIGMAAGAAGLIVLSNNAVESRVASVAQLQRWFLWKGAARMILRHPLMGWGTGMFLPHFADFKPTSPMRFNLLTMITLHPHNELLLVAVEVGLAGLALYLAGTYWTVRNALSQAQREPGAEWGFTVRCIVAGFVAMFAHGLVEVSLRFWAPGALYWTLVGTMLAVGNETYGARPCRGTTHRQFLYARGVATTLIVAVALGGIVWCGAKAEWLLGGAYRIVTLKRDDGTTTRAMRCVEPHGLFAWRERPTSPAEYAADMQRAASLSRYVPDYFKSFEKRATAWETAGYLDRAICVYTDLEEQAPGYGRVRERLGALHLRLAARATEPEDRARHFFAAAGWFEKALTQNPYDHGSRLGLAEVLLRASSRNLPRAIEHLSFLADEKNGRPSDAVLARALEIVSQARRAYAQEHRESQPALEEIEARLRTLLATRP